MVTKMKMIAVAVMALWALSSSAVYAADPEADPAQKKVWEEKRAAEQQKLYQELNLNDDQKKALEDNKNKSREQMKALREGMHDQMTQLHQELEQPELNMDKVTKIHNDLKASQAELSDRRLQSILEVRKILSPEQFKKFLADMKERHSKHEMGEQSGP